MVFSISVSWGLGGLMTLSQGLPTAINADIYVTVFLTVAKLQL